jgi:hypothetical protein
MANYCRAVTKSPRGTAVLAETGDDRKTNFNDSKKSVIIATYSYSMLCSALYPRAVYESS